MNYCFVENNTIVEGPRSLPRSWRNISGLDQMSEIGLRSIGWLPVRIDEGAVDDKYVGSMFAINPTEVVEVKLWSKYSESELNQIRNQKAEGVRVERNNLLSQSDWTQLNDTPLDNAAKVAWTNYRQALRDIPSQSSFPENVVWPVKP